MKSPFENKTLWVLVLLLSLHGAVRSQVFSTSVEVADEADINRTGRFPLIITGLPTSINKEKFGLEKVCITSPVQLRGAMNLFLHAPSGFTIMLMSTRKGDEEDTRSICFTQESKSTSADLGAEFSGDIKAVFSPGLFNNGMNPNGTWWLQADGYSLTSVFHDRITWSLQFGSAPAKVQHTTYSPLPKLVIETGNTEILNDKKVRSQMRIFDHGDIKNAEPSFTCLAGIEYRGSSSLSFAQRSYSIKTVDSTGKPRNVSLLGMPDEHDWVLNNHFRDHSLLRNTFSMQLWTEFGHYAPRAHYCELEINGMYMGLYALMEKIKIDKNRVSIKKLAKTDTSGISVTGGYLFKIDRANGADNEYWFSRYEPLEHFGGQRIGFLFDTPGQNKIQPAQNAYLKAYVDSFETAFALLERSDDPIGRVNDYIDLRSFIDYFIFTELSRNFDGFRASSYMYKKRNGKIYFGPVWDYDLAWGNLVGCQCDSTEGWAFELGKVCNRETFQVPFWWEKLMSNKTLNDSLCSRYFSLRQSCLSSSQINALIDSLSATAVLASDAHFRQWSPDVYTFSSTAPRPMKDDIEYMKNWIHRRLLWMDAHLRK